MTQYKQLSQSQVELWLNNPVTKAYLQCLWWSQDQISEVIGSGDLFDRGSMENTFRQLAEAEGEKNGYLGALRVVEELNRHEMLDPKAKIEMPDVKTIIEDV